MAKVLCPKCKGEGLTLEADGLLRCERMVPEITEDITFQRPCGYRGFEVLAIIGEDDDPEAAKLIQMGAVSGLSIDSTDLEELAEMPEGHRLYTGNVAHQGPHWLCSNLYCDFKTDRGQAKWRAEIRHASYLLEAPREQTADGAYLIDDDIHTDGAGARLRKERDDFGHPALRARLRPEGVRALPEDRQAQGLVEAASEALYAAFSGVTPEDLTPAGREEALEWAPFVRAIAQEAWTLSWKHAEPNITYDVNEDNPFVQPGD